MNLASTQIVAELIFKVIAIVAAITGAIWALYEYREAGRKENVGRALDYRQTLFEDAAFLNADKAVTSAWANHVQFRNHFGNQVISAVENQKPEEITQAVANWNQFVVGVVQRHGKVENELQLMIDRFNQLAICVNAGLCDSDTSVKFYGEYAQKLVHLHCPYILFRRSNGARKYAYYLEEFSGINCNDRFGLSLTESASVRKNRTSGSSGWLDEPGSGVGVFF